MDYLSRLIMIAENNGGIINNKIAAEHGVSRTILSKLCLDNKIQRIARGQYVFNDDMQDELLSIRPPTVCISHFMIYNFFRHIPGLTILHF